jgi:AcrR family transcriptional regulator
MVGILAEGAVSMAEAATRYRRDRSRLPAAQRRQQIMGATCELIADRGFWGLSMQDVADRCGLTVPGLLHYVGSKVGLLIAVLEHRDIEDARSLRVQLGVGEDEVPDDWSTGGPEGVDLRQLCTATVRRNAEQPEIVRLFAVLVAESLNPNHPAHDYFAARQARVVSSFAALATDLTSHPELLVRQIVAVMDGLQLQWLRTPETIDLVEEWEAAAETLFDHLADEHG